VCVEDKTNQTSVLRHMIPNRNPYEGRKTKKRINPLEETNVVAPEEKV
jgi:hypothetical protein